MNPLRRFNILVGLPAVEAFALLTGFFASRSPIINFSIAIILPVAFVLIYRTPAKEAGGWMSFFGDAMIAERKPE